MSGSAVATSDPVRLVALLSDYLDAHPEAALIEDGRVAFELRAARSSVREQHGRCLFELWGDEGNLLRTVVSAEARGDGLRLGVRRMGQSKPQRIDLVACSERRLPTARDLARRNFCRQIERVLACRFYGATVEPLRSVMDLEHSLGPAHVRGRIVQGGRVDAVLAVSAAESPAAIDGALTAALLWRNLCRERIDRRHHLAGLKLILPLGHAQLSVERLSWLRHAACELYTFDEATEELEEVEVGKIGNLKLRLVQAFPVASALARAEDGVLHFLSLIPAEERHRVEIRAHSPAEVGLHLHGLEFARVRQSYLPNSFTRALELSFGAGRNETLLATESEPLCRALFAQLFASRHPAGLSSDPLFRMEPERWLESELRKRLVELLPGLIPDPVYAQLPAVGGGARGVLDLLGVDRHGRLVVVELKTDEDLHLPLQALDYWMRVRELALDGQPNSFARLGYFAGHEVASLAPRLVMIAPALRIHPANEALLQCFSPEVEWELIALNEDWRRELQVVFRKRGGGSMLA